RRADFYDAFPAGGDELHAASGTWKVRDGHVPCLLTWFTLLGSATYMPPNLRAVCLSQKSKPVTFRLKWSGGMTGRSSGLPSASWNSSRRPNAYATTAGGTYTAMLP